MDAGSLPPPASLKRGIRFRGEDLRARFARFKRRVLFASSPSDSLANRSISGTGSTSDSGEKRILNGQRQEEDDTTDWVIDQIVVDSDFEGMAASNLHGRSSVSDRDASDPARTNGIDPSELAESIARGQPINSAKAFGQIVHLVMSNFFSSRFVEPQAEEQFQKERWYNTKFLAWLATIFMLVPPLPLYKRAMRLMSFRQIGFYTSSLTTALAYMKRSLMSVPLHDL